MNKRWDNILEDNIFNLIIFLCMFNYYWVHCFVLPSDFAQQSLTDSGLISILTIFFIMMAQVFVLWYASKVRHWRHKMEYFLLVYVLEIYLLREADLHRFLTSIHVTKMKFYLSPSIPLMQKTIAGVILLFFLFSFGYLLCRYGMKILRAFFLGESWAIAFFLWGALLLGSQILDKSSLNRMYDQWKYKAIEEIMELTASIYAMSSVLLYHISKNGMHNLVHQR